MKTQVSLTLKKTWQRKQLLLINQELKMWRKNIFVAVLEINTTYRTFQSQNEMILKITFHIIIQTICRIKYRENRNNLKEELKEKRTKQQSELRGGEKVPTHEIHFRTPAGVQQLLKCRRRDEWQEVTFAHTHLSPRPPVVFLTLLIWNLDRKADFFIDAFTVTVAAEFLLMSLWECFSFSLKASVDRRATIGSRPAVMS